MLNKILWIVCLMVFQVSHSQAQIWKRIQKSVEDKIEGKVNREVDGVLDGKERNEGAAVKGKKSAIPYLEDVYSFTPANQVVFEDNFQSEASGRMPKHWKSSGSGSVVNISDMPGKWLSLAPRTTYRIDSLLKMPENFTIEFDLVTRSEEAGDIGSMLFGFGRDNSSRSYIMDAYNDNAIAGCQLHFHNEEVTNSSSDTEIYNSLDFPLGSFSNALLHVAIAVEDTHMRIYLNKAKVLDTEMFKADAIKYFFLSAPFDYESDAKVFFGNFALAR